MDAKVTLGARRWRLRLTPMRIDRKVDPRKFVQ